MQNIQIKNGRVIDPKNKVDQVTDVFISQGKILALGETPTSFQTDTVIDATDLIVCPGLVDLSARLREPGDEYKATLASHALQILTLYWMSQA
jgi:dihydroorotase